MTVLTEPVAGTNQPRAADKLESLSPRCRRGEQVRELETALRLYQAGAGDPEKAVKWARVDLFSAFLSEDPTVSDKSAAKRLTRYEIVLQVGVFVPIFITWLSLAVAAFTASPGQSMLQSWESSGFLSLHWVAVATAVLVLILIFLTWRVFRRWSAAEAEEDELRQDLSEALTLAELELAPLRQGVTEQVARQMGKVEQSLKNVEQSLKNTADRFEGAGRTASRLQETATAAIGKLDPVLETVNTAIQGSRQATAELSAASQKLMDPLDRLATATRDISSATSESSRLFTRAMADATAEIAAATSASSSKIAASASASSAKIAASLDNQAAEIRTAVDEAVAAAGGYASRTEIVTDILGRRMAEIREVVDEIVAATGGYASRTEIATDILSQKMADIPDAVRSLHESLAHVDRQFSELTAALVRVQADTTQVLKSAPDQLAESVKALSGAAATVTQAENALASASETATRQVASIVSAATDIGGYASRAELTADALGKTHQALAEMPFAVRGLHEGVAGLGGQFADLAKAVADSREAARLMLQAASVLRDQAQAQAPDETSHRTGNRFSRTRS